MEEETEEKKPKAEEKKLSFKEEKKMDLDVNYKEEKKTIQEKKIVCFRSVSVEGRRNPPQGLSLRSNWQGDPQLSHSRH